MMMIQKISTTENRALAAELARLALELPGRVRKSK